MDNSRILVIPDLHLPYQHIDAIDFLTKLKKTLNPTRIICLGDELDYHALHYRLGLHQALSREILEVLAEAQAQAAVEFLETMQMI